MKTAAKVFLIIGMVSTFYLIFPVVIGIIAINKLENAKDDEDLKVWAWLSIFLVSTIGGVFMLLMISEGDNVSQKSAFSRNKRISNSSTKLTELKTLYDDGIIDEKTYNEKRKEYLRDL
jgi:hypothetical protein